MEIERVLDRQATTQHGLLTKRQLRALGLTEAQIRRRVAQGKLLTVHRGVYRCQGASRSWSQDLLAVCLATGPGSAASHRAACALWELDLGIDPVVEVTVSRPRCPRPDGVILHRSLDLTPDFVTLRYGIPATKPLRLLVDLGAVLPLHLVSRALEQLVTRRVVTVAGARAARDQLGRRGRSGAGVLGEVLDRRALRETRAESMLEVAFAELSVRFHLPMPAYQYRLIVGGEARRIDFAFPDLKIAIEVDGYAYHREWESFQDERIRGNALELEGWLVLRFTWDQVMNRPDEVARTVRRALRQRAATRAA